MRSLLNTETENANQQIAELEADVIKKLEAEGEEENKPAEKPKEESTQTQQEPSEDENTETANEQEGEENQEDTKDEDANAKEDLSKKGNDRVASLANERNTFKQEADKVPDLEKEVNRLRKLLGVGVQTPGRPSNQSTADQTNTPFTLPWQEAEENRELTPEQLQAAIKSEANTQIQNQRILDTLNYDISTVEDSYPELRAPTDDNPNPDFDEKLTSNVTKWYETLFKEDHSLRFSDFVNQIMSLKAQGEERGRKAATANASDVLKQQDAEQAIDTSGSPAGKADTDLETKIRSARSSKDLQALEALLPHAE